MKKSNLWAIILTISPGFAMTSCKWGAEQREGSTEVGEAGFGDFDLDRNGFLNADEIRRYKPDITTNFETIDVDRDQQVSEEEFKRYGEGEH
ncbi:MAG: hypothetical protein M3Q07_17715 [Pseudobdellovibrionaceae bacterium]|nr:hypothetical protein [Pseudobdellovibrionaceae bacterium]